jgi:hypothetical protein
MDTLEAAPLDDAADREDGSRRFRWPVWLPRVLFESALIVFSVLLALAVDEWRDSRNQADRARVAVDAIVAELQGNRRAAERALAFHREITATLGALAAKREQPSREVAFGGLLQPARAVSTAWTSARATGTLDQLPYDLVLRVSRVYERQSSYDELTTQRVADIYIDIRRRGADEVLIAGYQGFITLASDFANREQELIANYDTVLSLLRQPR